MKNLIKNINDFDNNDNSLTKWEPFEDKFGPNKSFPINNHGLEMHIRNGYDGPAKIKNVNEVLESLQPGTALFMSGIMNAAEKGCFRK